MQRSPFKTTIQDKTESESAFKTNINICHSKIQNVGKGKQTFFYIYSGPKLYQKRRNMLFSLPNNLTLWKWDELRNFSLFARSKNQGLTVHSSHQSNGVALKMAALSLRRRRAGWTEKWNGADEFLPAPGLLSLTSCSDCLEHYEESHFPEQGH